MRVQKPDVMTHDYMQWKTKGRVFYFVFPFDKVQMQLSSEQGPVGQYHLAH